MTINLSKARVWDLPTRVFHWLMVLAFITAWLTNEDSRYLHIHVFAGYSFGGLLAFRVLWGLVGSHYARFKQFSYSPQQVITYLQTLLSNQRQHYVGHNPAGSWAIYLMILGGLLLTISGLCVLGGQEQHGPLAGLLSFEQGDALKELHEAIATGLLMLVFVHIAGVIVESRLHGENLARAMITGQKLTNRPDITVPKHTMIAALLLLFVGAGAWYMFGGYLFATKDKPYLPFKGPELAQDSAWQENCGECHLAFHPSLLPARSWQKLFATQADHFGEDLALDEETVKQLLTFSQAQSSEHHTTEAAWQINHSVKSNQTPLRISETEYWQEKHEEISDTVWKQNNIKSKANCNACHQDAKLGTFEDAGMSIPN